MVLKPQNIFIKFKTKTYLKTFYNIKAYKIIIKKIKWLKIDFRASKNKKLQLKNQKSC